MWIFRNILYFLLVGCEESPYGWMLKCKLGMPTAAVSTFSVVSCVLEAPSGDFLRLFLYHLLASPTAHLKVSNGLCI